LALVLLAWRLSPAGLKMLTEAQTYIAYAVVAALAIYQYIKIWQVNQHLFGAQAARPYQYQLSKSRS
jgi:NNP family nitrate/nitrite transporter-like MFS transporter